MSEFDQVRAIVTGGASGIGLATAQLLAERGAIVGVLDREVDEDSFDWACVRADVTDNGGVRDAVDLLVATLGGLDVLVNNAGVGAQGGILDNDIAEWQRCFDVNVFGTVRVTQAALPHLRASTRAAVVNTASVAALTGLPSRVLYSATKGAIYAMTLAMAADFCRSGIRVNAVLPGTTNTPWIGRLLDAAADPDAERGALSARQPMGRLVEAAEVARTICYLASPLQSATTGVGLPVDAGFSALRIRA